MISQNRRQLLAAAGMSALQVVLLGVGAAAQAQTSPTGSVPDGGGPAPNAPSPQGDLAEIVVTAQRRTQSLQDIPYNISAVSADYLEKSGITSINNLSQVIPGLQNVDTGPDTAGGNNNFILRGLRTDGASIGAAAPSQRRLSVSTVSTYLGDTPIFYPLSLDDLDRIEVLRGPQGTLYGSGAEAGTIRFIPKQPDFNGLSGNVSVEGSKTHNAVNGNYKVNGALNIPLAENLALRVVAGDEHLAGFINAVDLVQRQTPGDPYSPPVSRVPSDPLSGYALAPVQRGVNSSDEWYARASLRWKASEAVEVELSYMHQSVHVADAQLANPTYLGGVFNFGLGGGLFPNVDAVVNDPNATIAFRRGGKYNTTEDILSPSTDIIDLGSLLVTADLGFATVTSSSSAYRVHANDGSDATATEVIPNGAGSFATYAVAYNGYPRFTYYFSNPSRDQAFTQELRLVSKDHGPFNYVVGAYFQDQDFNYAESNYIPGLNAYAASANPQYGDLVFYAPFDNNGFTFRDKALFGELTYKITPQWQITGGARFFWQDFDSFAKGYFNYGGAPYSLSGVDPTGLGLDVNNPSRVADHIAKFNTSYDLSPELKVYATYSEGFRRGGANTVAPAGPYASLPQYLTFKPDKAKNYEMGVKGETLDRKLRFSADVYLIDLKNFQFTNSTPAGYVVTYNGTAARSEGVELETELRATRNLTLQASYSYTKATVRQGFTLPDYAPGGALTQPPTLVTALSLPAGAKLPAVPANTANVGADYSIPIGSAGSVELHADASYRSSSPATIDPTSVYYYVIPHSFFADSRVTYDPGKAWTWDLFVNNITDETAYTGGDGLQTIPNPFAGRYVARPRTFGTSLRYKF